MAGISFVNQYTEYPIYFVELGFESGNYYAFWMSEFVTPQSQGGSSYPSGDLGPGPTNNDNESGLLDGAAGASASDILSALQSWAEGFSWYDDTLTSFTATKYSESVSDATP
jgi:hypothetical protein